MDNAQSYLYQLTKTDDGEVLSQGSTEELSMEFSYSTELDLLYSTSYTFSVQAVINGETTQAATATVVTSEAAIALSVTDITYRSAKLTGIPTDNTMKYQFAQIPMEKYTAYASDMEFIEGYDYGYYQAYAKPYPIKWYTLMENLSKTGPYEYTTTLLEPEREYLLYAYGVEFDSSNPENPVAVTTPLIKLPFTTPAWEATSDCTFDIEVTDQRLVTDQDGNLLVDVTAHVTPSSNKEYYYVCFYETDLLGDYDLQQFAFDLVLNAERYFQITDWTQTQYAYRGERDVNGAAQQFCVTPGKECFVVVFGVNESGIVTTAAQKIDFTSMPATGSAEATVASRPHPMAADPCSNLAEDRQEIHPPLR